MISNYTVVRSLVALIVSRKRSPYLLIMAVVAIVLFTAKTVRAQEYCGSAVGEFYGTEAQECTDTTPPYMCEYRSGNGSIQIHVVAGSTIGTEGNYIDRNLERAECDQAGQDAASSTGGTVFACETLGTTDTWFYRLIVNTSEPCRVGNFDGSQCVVVDAPDCLCAVDDLPNNAELATDCDREALQYCQATGTYIPATSLCLVNDCTNATYAALHPGECSVDEEPPVNSCTGDYYTDPVTRQIVCGTYDHTSDSGVNTMVTTDQSGNTQITTLEPDGTVVSTTQYADGSSTTSVTDANGNVTAAVTSVQGNITTFSGAGEDDDCPSNSYSAINTGISTQLVCKDVLPADTGTSVETSGTALVGGGCAVSPSCSGDQIQCAIFHEEWLQRCISEDQNAEVEVDLLSEFGNFGFDETEEGIPNITTSLTDVVFDAAGFLPSNMTCSPVGVLNVYGTSIPINITLLCSLSEKLSYIVMLISYFIAGRIVLQNI